MEARQEGEWIRHKSGPIGGKIDRAALTSRAAMRPNSVIIKSSHLSGFNRGLETLPELPRSPESRAGPIRCLWAAYSKRLASRQTLVDTHFRFASAVERGLD
jgi:hypothetical protein